MDCCTSIPFVCTLQRPADVHAQPYLLNSAAAQGCCARQWSETKKVCSCCAVPQGRHCLRNSTHACHNDAAAGNFNFFQSFCLVIYQPINDAYLQPHSVSGDAAIWPLGHTGSNVECGSGIIRRKFGQRKKAAPVIRAQPGAGGPHSAQRVAPCSIGRYRRISP